MPELTSKHIVDAIDTKLSARVEKLKTQPGLAILSNNGEHYPSLKYMELKQKIAGNLGIIAAAIFTNGHEELLYKIQEYNDDKNCHGMIVQLPLVDQAHTDNVLDTIIPSKDVDGLGRAKKYIPATPLGIVNLLEGYSIDYINYPVAVVGTGKLVGAPLVDLMQERGANDISAYNIESSEEEVRDGLNRAKVIVSATGKSGLLVPELFDNLDTPRVVIDAGTAESNGAGDVSPALREELLTKGSHITAEKGSVGPLTIRALLSNLVLAAEIQTN
jgi:methylenetetrahydrofolate dehydrogenase (NADP+)/methenyltetrahydrofolate cyclohydrolase